jgi:hypothetical protein
MSIKERLRLNFARKIAVAVAENPEMRLFLKTEALKMINNDFDVFYPVIKDKNIKGAKLKSNGGASTFRNILLQYFDDESELIEIEQQLPLLTIFVPELPENSFSAESWDPNNPEQNPVVAVRLSSSSDVPMIDNFHNQEYVVESDLIPAYPVIVIKDNERIELSDGSSKSNQKRVLECNTEISASPTYNYIDDNFNPCITDPWAGGGGSSGGGSGGCSNGFEAIPGRDATVDQFLIDAYNVFDRSITTPWQRDNIYYQLTPTRTTNAYTGGKFVEALTYFELQGSDPQHVFSIISDQSGIGNNDPLDANHDWDHDARDRTPWTDGFFEFEVSIEDNAVNRAIKNTPVHFDAAPDELFEYEQETVVRTRGVWPVTWKRTYWRPIITGFKGMSFINGDSNQNLDIHPWDLLKYSNTWTLRFAEFDTSEDKKITSTNSVTFNTNVEANVNFPGDAVKFGLKYGASIQRGESDEITTEVKLISDEIGEMDIHFYDRVLNKNSCDNKLYPKLYKTSYVKFELRPVQVEF